MFHASRSSDLLPIHSLTGNNVYTQGARNELHPLEHAENLRELLTGVDGGAILVPIIGSSRPMSYKQSITPANVYP